MGRATGCDILRTMLLSVGTKLGPYEIVAPLGAGGMGEVYRARDPRIGREVAVKVLPRSFAEDEDRLRRFTQEARAAGTLNHPNLLTIYDLGTANGTPYIVSELLEGETLRQRLPVSQRKAVDYALQIATGAAAAHERGIIHRDLKPENIFITGDERIKLLDFGLVKILAESESAGQSSTLERITDPGMVMGTASYMSPEQVRGQQLDHRTDIFSLGTVLCEMLTGSQPFQRGSQIETMNAILKEDPGFKPGAVYPALERITLHALEKNPAHRFQSMKDVAFALETFSGSGESIAVTAKTRRAEKRVEKKPIQYTAITFRRGFIMAARCVRDGSVVYGAAWEDKPLELFASIPGDPHARPLGIPETDILAVNPVSGELAVSLGRHIIAGWISSGTLARLPLGGGAPREIAEDIHDADWSPDGKNLGVIRRAGDLFVIDYPIGHRIFESGHWISHCRFSPAGDLIAFIDHPLWGDDGGSVVVIDLQGEKKVQSRFWTSTGGLAWTPKGDEVWVAGYGEGGGRDICAVSLSGKERIVLSIPDRNTLHDIRSDGDVLLSLEPGRREVLCGRRGTSEERNLSWFDWTFPSDIAGDGSRILIEEQGLAARGPVPGIYVRKTDGSPAVHLGEGRVRALSPDAKWVVAKPSGSDYLELMPVGAGESRRIPVKGLAGLDWWYWFPDQKRLLLWANESGHGNRMHELPIDGDGTVRSIGPEGTEWPMAISPDGAYVVATSPDQRLTIYSTDNSNNPREVPGSRRGDRAVLWGTDNGLYVYRYGRLRATIDRIDLTTGARSEWQELKPSDPAGVHYIMPAYVSANLEWYAYGYRRFLSSLYLVRGLL